MSKKISQQLGGLFAHLQNALDDGVQWGAQKLIEVSKKTTPKKNEEPSRLEEVGRSAAGFVGEFFSEYLKKYEELKQKKMSKEEKSSEKKDTGHL